MFFLILDDWVIESTYLSVLYPPIFENKEEIVYGWKGKAVNLSCAHESKPNSDIYWR